MRRAAVLAAQAKIFLSLQFGLHADVNSGIRGIACLSPAGIAVAIKI